jgi:hypothetical protein
LADRAGHSDQASLRRAGPVMIGVNTGVKSAAEARDPRMKRSASAIHEDMALVLCRGRSDRRVAPIPGSVTRRKVS